MSNKWQEIWNKKERLNKIILDLLIKADGFDIGSGKLDVNDWISYTSSLYSLIGISTGDKIFEFGCGSGAFLYPLFLRNFEVAGIDYSKELIEIAQKFLSYDSFFVSNAEESIHKNTSYDIVLSHGVFMYFPDLIYAEKVFKNMVNLSKNKIAILDVCDLDKFDDYDKKRLKRFIDEGFTKEQYRLKYEGLDHLFYNKKWFIELSKKYNLKIKIIDQNYENYGNSEFRFNVILEK